MIFNRLPELLCIAGSVITGFTILRYGFSVKKIKNELRVRTICISLAVSAVTGAVFCSMSYLQDHKDRSYTLKLSLIHIYRHCRSSRTGTTGLLL